MNFHKNKYILFFTRLFVLLLLLYIGDRIGGRILAWCVDHASNRESLTNAPKIRAMISRGVEDSVLVMGTSRAERHYVPSILEDTLGVTVYNVGLGATYSIYSQYFLLAHIVETGHLPSYILLDVYPDTFLETSRPFAGNIYFAPFIGRNRNADTIFKLEKSHILYQISHLYRYSPKTLPYILGVIFYSELDPALKGFRPLEPSKNPVEPIESEFGRVDSCKMSFLQRFYSLCQRHNIKLVLCASPMFVAGRQDIYAPIAQFAAEQNLTFFDYTYLYEDDPSRFRDPEHLVESGARTFSQRVASDLKGLLRK